MMIKNCSRQTTISVRLTFAALAMVFCSGTAFAWNTLTPLTNQVVCPGGTAVFSAVAGGPTPYKFEWRKNGVVLAGKTNNTLTLTNVGPTDAATYSLKLTGGYSSVTNSATLTVRTNVSATALTDLIRSVGANAAFSTVASGTGPFTYSWMRNGAILPGKSSSTLVLTNLTLLDSGTYSVVVSGACSSVTNSANLTVDSCFPAVDVMLVIDRSGSMTGKPYNDARAACSNFVQNLHFTNDQAGLASYNSLATLDQKLTNSLQRLNQAIGGIPGAGGTTSITLGLQTGQTELASARHRSNALPVMVLLSDGLPTGSDSPSNALYAATQAKNAGTRIFTVGLGDVDGALMSGIASAPGDYFYTTNSSQLSALFNAISTIICRPPTNIVTVGPSNLTVCAGSTAAFSVTASGCDSFGYQWRKDGVALPGQTNNSLVINNAQAASAGIYSVAITSVCKSVTNSATLTVNENLVVSTAPANVTTCPGTTASFSVVASGTGLAYQWFKGTSLLAGQTTSSLVLTNVNAASAGIYSVAVSGTCGNTVTNSATLTVSENIIVSTPPASLTNCPGTTASFSVVANGTGLAYQWFKGNSLLAGQTASSLVLTNVSAASAGIYSVAVSGTCGNAVTNSASLTVSENVVVSTPPASLTNCPGTTASFSVVASGTGLAYQWFKGTSLLAGQTASSLVLTNVSAASAGIYSVAVSGTCGNAVTNSATLTVSENIVVSAPPASLTNCPGTTASFSVVASGTGLAYQWFKGSSLLAGQTTSSLVLTNVNAASAGIYSVAVSGTCGNAVTNSATLTVSENIVVSTPPASLTNCPGTTASFTVVASGTGLAYQWFKGTNALTGETNSSLILSAVSLADAGAYSLVVSGSCGEPVTNLVFLALNTPVTSTALASLVRCPGDSATFSTLPGGTGPFSFVWRKNGALLAGQSGSSLLLVNVSASDAASYSVEVGGACGTVTNIATLALNSLVTLTPLISATRNLGEQVTFTTTASGAGPFTFTWRKNGALISGATGNSLTLSNLGFSDAGTYSVGVAGACNSAAQSAVLVINHPPVVSIVSPTNGQIFIAPATFSVLADARDEDGTISRVEFFLGADFIGDTTNSSPYFVVVTNLPAGNYQFTARATDNLGATAVSTPVNVTVLQRPPLTIVAAMRFNPQTGLFEQTVRVTNPTYSTFEAVRVYAADLPPGARVYNASGVTNGVGYVQSTEPIAPGSYVDFLIEYYVPSRIPPNPTLTAELVQPSARVTATGVGQHIDRLLVLHDRTVLVEFSTVTNQLYYVQYSSNLLNWKTAVPVITGNGTRIQWIDNGQPKTESSPATQVQRFYRLISLP